MSDLKVAATHPQYDSMIYVWRLVRDFVGGQSFVKRQNTLYLPIPSAMTAVAIAPDTATTAQQQQGREIGGFTPGSTRSNFTMIDEKIPWFYPSNLAYQSYLRRARVPDITSFALRGLLGIATRKKPTIELPDSIAYLEDNATSDGFDIYEMFSFIVGQILQTGRIGLLLNVTDDNKFIFNMYSSDACLNWKEKVELGNRKLRFVVLQEDDQDTEDDPFTHEFDAKYLVLGTDDDDKYKVDIFTEKQTGDDPQETKEPKIQGLRTKEIPFIFIGSIDNTPDVDESPLQGVADLANQIYMKSADLSNAEFMTCNPTLIMTGVDDDQTPRALGSNVVISISNHEADVFYTETDTSGLDHMLKHIESLTEEAAAFGATLLGARKKGVESEGAMKIHQSIGGATLHSAVVSAGSAIEKLLNLGLRWKGSSDVAVFDPSVEFSDISIDSGLLTSMLKTYLQGGMSLETLVEYQRRSGLLEEGISVEEAIAQIETRIAGSGLDDDDLDDEDEQDVDNLDDEDESGNNQVI